MSETTKTPAQRRRFLKGAATAAGAAGALAAPMISRAQTTSLRFQSTWPSKDIFHEYAQDFAKKVNDMAGGRLKIEVLPAGAVVPAFQLLDAVAKGTLDGGHGVIAYWYGKNTALALWGSGPAFGMDANMVLAWHNYGGGKALARRSLQEPQPRRRLVPVRPDADAAARLVQEADRPRRGHERPEVPHRRTRHRRVHRHSALRSIRCPAVKSFRRSTAACSTPPSSTTRRATACSASRTWPRTACCRASTRAASSSR